MCTYNINQYELFISCFRVSRFTVKTIGNMTLKITHTFPIMPSIPIICSAVEGKEHLSPRNGVALWVSKSLSVNDVLMSMIETVLQIFRQNETKVNSSDKDVLRSRHG